MQSKFFRLSLALLVVSMLLVPTMSWAETKFFAIATGGTAGTYYPLGGALAQALSSTIADLEVTAQTSNASVANCSLIGNHEVESAFIQNNVAYWAVNGTGVFEGKEPIKNLRAIASLYPEVFHFVTTKKSGVTSMETLKGKRVSPGDRGSGTEADFRGIVQALGMKYEDFGAVDYLALAGAVERVKDGQLDMLCFTGGYPMSGILDLSTAVEINFISFTDEEIAKIKAALPYVIEMTIPKGTYPGQTEDVKTLSVMAQWVVDADVSEDMVYQITKALWEKQDVTKGTYQGQQKSGADIMGDAHVKGKEVVIGNALNGNAIPLHPGAEKYYKEIGVIK